MFISLILNLLAVFILLLGVGAVTSAGFLYGAPFLLLGALTFPKVKAAVMQKSGHAHAKRNYSLSLAGLTVISLMAAAMAPDVDTERGLSKELDGQTVWKRPHKKQQRMIDSLTSVAKTLESNEEHWKAAEHWEMVDSLNGDSAHSVRAHDLRRFLGAFGPGLAVGYLSREQAGRLKKGVLDTQMLHHKDLNELYIQEMHTYVESWDSLSMVVRELEEQVEKNERQNERFKQIKAQFSPTTGWHRELVTQTIQRLHDPNSFSHVETRFEDKEDHVLLYMQYRAKNTFGALVLNEVGAKADIDGNILALEFPE